MVSPISSNSSDFPWNSADSSYTTASKLEENISVLRSQVTQKNLTDDALVKISKAVLAIQALSQKTNATKEDTETSKKVRDYAEDALKALSTGSLSILSAVEEDNKQQPPSLENLRETLATFKSYSAVSQCLSQELDLIAKDIHNLRFPASGG